MEDTHVLDAMQRDTNLSPLMNIIDQIMNLDDNQLNENNIDIISGMMTGAFTSAIKESAVQSVLQNYHNENYTRQNARQNVHEVHIAFDELLEELKPSQYKQRLLEEIFNIFYNIFDEALARYLITDIDLPIKLDEGAIVPTYAHDTDAAADLYAADTITLPAHSTSNMIRTGVHIALPEGWMAMIFPRSSIGAKTGLRLSNSAGIIDNEYRGALGILYDNISDSDYTINAGDRIAQLIVLPSYRFKAQVVDILPSTERGEDGFGSSGK